MSNLTLKTLLEAKELRAERQQALCRKYQQRKHCLRAMLSLCPKDLHQVVF